MGHNPRVIIARWASTRGINETKKITEMKRINEMKRRDKMKPYLGNMCSVHLEVHPSASSTGTGSYLAGCDVWIQQP